MGNAFFFFAAGSLRQQRSDGFQAGVTRLVQRDVQDLAEVDRVGGPELIGATQLGDRGPVFQGDAGERIVWRDLNTYVVGTTLSDKSDPRANIGVVPRERGQSYVPPSCPLADRDGRAQECLV